MNLHLTQAKRNSPCRHKTTSLLFKDAVIVLKLSSTLEGCVYLASCNNNNNNNNNSNSNKNNNNNNKNNNNNNKNNNYYYYLGEVGRRVKTKLKINRIIECPWTMLPKV